MKATILGLITFALAAQDTLPGTSALRLEGDAALKMVDGIHRFLDGENARAREARSTVTPRRERLRQIIGAVDTPADVTALEYVSTTAAPALIGTGPGFKVYAVRWPVLDGVHGEGLLLEPDRPPNARIVALPDADTTPEVFAAEVAGNLAAKGAQVVIPTLIDRRATWSGIPGVRMTNQPHREFIYRMAFEVGRHIIGYEVLKTLAVVNWFERQNAALRVPIRVMGYGEGGLIAFHGAALDERIGSATVSGYFGSRDAVWQEPVYRDVWGLLREFDDVAIAKLIAPRELIVDAGSGPRVDGPPPESPDRKGATPNGKLAPVPVASAEAEAERAGIKIATLKAIPTKLDLRKDNDPSSRQERQFRELVAHVQTLVQQSPKRRVEFWKTADSSSPERWKETTKPHREHVWSEMIGRLPDPSLPPNARTRLIYDEPKFRGYEVALDVWPDVFAYGILLVPKDLRAGERRPVVVCQHGLEGRPADVANPKLDHPAYHTFAVRLAEQGFITFSPQNPYTGQDRYRTIQRKAHPLKLSLFSFILGQHQRILEWLATQPFVDASRIGFYGLSYGGKTAVRVPPLLDGYALSICSADFNEWVWKNTSADAQYSYMVTGEYDMMEFNLANLANYSDLANLMAPRPFMVERGHADGVAPDEWVAYEFAKVRRFYTTRMGLADRAEIEFFNGPHTINGKGTFEFLRKHLRWPER
ncbi:MAG: hypothetical protein EXQ52_14560 [Bryobacterales bacterium]|nr:hypothetical protein [Bryobacterales bacterium]